ncbi:mechanosensitive ion channel domain-containing protein [Paractinoplanes lichenicola]|uniref:Mechanosensitive ion channel family protein n=1 Tax=Paractinoplanes lichenicola TaxID=2802976 RepID=A0ABS1VWI0_9ACTN|nr:mechanosensitive ion channel family protein [Actinoplanes lichenicola]MBL7258846.1 mechanosensitive ion channel family protein [Actinoplanes lichenicola]
MFGVPLLEQHVRPDFRKTVVYGLVALAALIVGSQVGDIKSVELRDRLIAYGCAVVVAVGGIMASRTASREVHRVTQMRAGDAAATPLRLLVLLGGYLIAVFAVCDLLGVGLQHLLVGGAVTGVILGLAAQPVLSNLFAGLVLLFARPYIPGQQVRVLSGAIGGPHYGTIISAGLLYTVLETSEGPLNIPNSALLASAVGPSEGEPDDQPADPADPVPADHDAAALATAAAIAETADDANRKDNGE